MRHPVQENNPRPVKSHHGELEVSEWASRTRLAAIYRLAAHYGWSANLYNHAAARVPGEPFYLVKPHSLMFHEVRASDLLKLPLDGTGIDDSVDVNAAALVIHTAVLNARPELNYSLHVHTIAGAAFSAQGEPLLPIYQRAMLFHNRLSYHDFEGLADDADEVARLARDLGPRNKALVLRNHGLLTMGVTAAECLTLMQYLVESCEVQMTLHGRDVRLPSEAVCERTALQYERVRPSLERSEWAAYVRLADRLDSSFKD